VVHLAEPVPQNPANGGVAIIGKGMIIKGSIHSQQDLLLDGEIDGELVIENCRLTVGPHGKAVANAVASEVDIQGSVTGNVECTGKTSIRASGWLVGDVRTAGIVIESGAYFKGKVEITNSREQANSASQA
jgi:cytoskeletal protein CcmA (bactofilin family)